MIEINVIKNHEFKFGNLKRVGIGNFEFITYYINLKENNINGKPARRIFNEYDIIKELYAIDGALHKINGPAEIIYKDCAVTCKRYYVDGKFIKENSIKRKPKNETIMDGEVIFHD